MNKPYLNILLSILIIAALSAAIVSAEHHPANKQNNNQDMSAASASLKSADYHSVNSCKDCHNHGGEIPDLRSKQNNQQDRVVAPASKSTTPASKGTTPASKGTTPASKSVASVSLTSTEYHHVDSCMVCHDMSGSSSNLHLVFEVINTPNSGLKDVIFTAYEGTNSYADGDTTYNGVCEVCHTETRHHRNDGNNPDPDSHYANTSCRECHAHEDEFSHGGGSGSGCEDCHGHDLGYEYEPDKFSEGAGTIKSHSTHTENDNDDLKGPNIPCDACHDIDNYPYFKSGTGDAPYDLIKTNVCDPCHSPGGAFDGIQMAKANWDDGIYEADSITIKSENEKWCASCHDSGVAFSRAEIIDPVIVDNLAASFAPSESAWPHSTGKPPFNGPDVQYHAAGGDGSATATWTPDLPNDGVYNVYAMWTSYWNRADNTPYTIHYTGDGGGTDTKWVNQQQEGGMWVKLGTYPFLAGTGGSVVLSDNAIGGTIIIADAVMFEYVDNMGAYAPNVAGDDSQTYGYYVEGSGHGLTCTVCHDASAQHIDHNQRTYEIDETTCDPGPCVVVNSYEDGYRLSDVAGQRPMVIPKESVDNSNELDPAKFALCFKCHDSEPILSLSWDDTNFKRDTDPYERNFHQYHLGMQADIWDSDWDAVINGIPLVSVESMPSCTACHNVHGSPSAAMIRHGELISPVGTTYKVPSLDFSYLDSDLNRDPSILLAYPDSKGGSMYFRGYPERGNFVCRDCHGGFIEHVRIPQDIPTPVVPIISNAAASPVSIANDGSVAVLFTAFVVDPNENLNSVEVGLLALGESATQQMFDDGTNGDVEAGDDIYSYELSGTTASIGNYKVTITAEDSDMNTGTGEAPVVVHDDYGAIIVDNLEADFVCGWNLATGLPTQLWGFDVHYRRGSGDGSCTATWSFEVPTTGDYNVYARWTSNIYRATHVPYTINYEDETLGPLSHTVWVDQQQNGGTWFQLGSGPYRFEAGTTGSVVLSDDSTGGPVSSRRDYIIADAIRLSAT